MKLYELSSTFLQDTVWTFAKFHIYLLRYINASLLLLKRKQAEEEQGFLKVSPGLGFSNAWAF